MYLSEFNGDSKSKQAKKRAREAKRVRIASILDESRRALEASGIVIEDRAVADFGDDEDDYDVDDYDAVDEEDEEEDDGPARQLSGRKRRSDTSAIGQPSARRQRSSNEEVLHFPFGEVGDAFGQSSLGLLELGGSNLGVVQPADASVPNAGNRSQPRSNCAIIRQDDMDRLKPGKLLSDSLLDFWMLW